MAIEPKSRRDRKAATKPAGFDITQVIGHVELVDDGPLTPYQAAFAAIAEFGNPGDFRFPAPFGEGNIRVLVEHETPHDLNSDVMTTEPEAWR